MRVLAFDIGICNLAWCVADVSPDSSPNIINCSNIRIGNAKDPIAELLASLVVVLNEKCTLLQENINTVVIEQQVALKASKNQSLSAALFMFYANLRLTSSVLENVRFSHPRAKFKKVLELSLEVLDPFRKELKEARGPALKKLSVQVTKVLLLHWQCSDAYTQLCVAKKKDDIADSVLLACLC